MQNRYMCSATGRFISLDPMEQGTNWYVYCDNNPATKIDVDGNFPLYGSSYNNFSFSHLYYYNTGFYNWRPSNYSSYSFGEYARSDWLPKFYDFKSTTETRYLFNSDHAKIGEFTSERLNFLTNNPIATPSLSSLNRLYSQNDFMKDYSKWEISNTFKESIKFAGGIASGIGNFAKDFAVGTVNSTTDMIGAIMGDWDASERIGKGFVDAVTSIPKLPQMFGNAMDNYQNASIYDKGKTLGYNSLALTSMVFPFTKGIGKSGTGEILASGTKISTDAGKWYKIPRGSMSTEKLASLSDKLQQEIAVAYHPEYGRILVFGNKKSVILPEGTTRFIAHTHVKNKLRPSSFDLQAINNLDQSRSLIVNLDGSVSIFYKNGETFIIK